MSRLAKAVAAAFVIGMVCWSAAPELSLAGAELRVAQAEAVVIVAPKRLKTEQDTVDFSGRVEAAGEVTLSVDGTPVAVDGNGAFRIRRQVPVGRTRLLLVAEDSHGGRAEQRVFVRRVAVGGEAGDFGDYRALVVGNNEYRHLSDLRMAVADAEAVAKLLEDRYGFEVETLINATRADIVSALSRLRAELTESDSLLIYYAGHGSLDVGSDEGYWLPVDAEPDSPVNWVSNSTITGQLRAMTAKHVMVVADSCYSGKLTRNVEAQLKTGAERSAWLERMAARRSRTALTSGGLEPVLDAGGGGHSVFAKAFLDALRANTQVLDGQGLFDAIKRPIVVNADQTPEYADVRKAGHDGGDFLFVPITVNLSVSIGNAPAPAAQAALDQGATERLFWQTIKDSGNAADYQAYLDAYPTGVFATLARTRIEALSVERLAAVVPPPVPSITIDEMDATYVVLKTSNVRAGPTTEAERIGRLTRDDAVAVTGKVAGKDWYRIELDGDDAFIFGSLIAEVDPAELAAWSAISDSRDSADFDGFLGDFPNGHFKDRAAAGRDALAEPAPEAVDHEMAFWDTIKDSRNPGDYRAYLYQYPNGAFAELARARIAEAERQAAAAEAERKRLAAEEAQRKAAEAAAKAQQETTTAALEPADQAGGDLNAADLIEDEALKAAIKKYYDKQKYKAYHGSGESSAVRMYEIRELEMANISGNFITVNVSFIWQAVDYTFVQKSSRGTAVVQKNGSIYEVMKFTGSGGAMSFK